MQRYFVPSSGWNDSQVVITGEDVHHIGKVMRMKPEHHILCCTPEGDLAECEITDITTETVTCQIVEWLEEEKELPASVTIAQGLPKGDKMEHVIQKGTELGASQFIPFEAERSIVKWDQKKSQKKITRYQKIAKEASEQSHRTMIPSVSELHSLGDLIALQPNYDWVVFAYEDEAKSQSYRSLKEVLTQFQQGQRILVIIGPEGGFSEQEVQTLKEAGALAVRLGPRILRTETAATYFLSALSYQLEELG
ncbi:16S rRNA (uracil(1498)-N(3))-methyltransferase [Pontibacillus salipaludis]|uniref:Ribosomal RNA small subunit methyltransferase E n=1 Tax=Pontibacillus salipaludis TaxID=1697394 RepID=A0ABQ1PVN3_9BACI|nr:16S rRNA (uracil(1498)-N(3))-methyltransferase [Pontibacillus salipaludis]GGD04400.1 ribosomal RNA small subunit methyltransferase E [Pontibacillus salipaludis]